MPTAPIEHETPRLPAGVAWPAGIKRTSEFEAAIEHVRNGDGHLFITGKAGSGKSTLLKCMRDLVAEEMVVLAPTGLAAVNVGGQTIHSFFGFPPRLIRSDDIRRSRNGRLMRRLKLLVIDEVSMVRSDMIEAASAAPANPSRIAGSISRPALPNSSVATRACSIGS